ncbi:MAG: adenylate synthase [Roseivirga sp.]|nr:adenylate synthase [Roseivirga sp.]
MRFKLLILYHFIRFRLNRKYLRSEIGLAYLRERRKRKWRKHLKRSAFYQDLAESDLSDFPLMDKASFMEHFDAINSVGISREEAFAIALKSEESRDFSSEINGVTVGLSSGTSGNKGIFLASLKERAVWVAAVLDRVIGFSLRKRKVAFFLRSNSNLYESVGSSLLSFSYFDIKADMKQNLEKLVVLNPHILVGQPSVLLAVSEYYRDMGINSGFEKVISVAEVLEEDVAQRLEQVFKAKTEQVYQCTEGFLAHTCEHRNLHFNEDWLHIEKKYLDEENKRFHPVITDYLRSSQPIIRYELNDIIQEGETCNCGLKSTVIRKIEGRSDDVFVLRNRRGEPVIIYPDFVRRAVITASDDITNYVVTLIGSNELSLYIETGKGRVRDDYELASTSLHALFESFDVDGLSINEQKAFVLESGAKFKRVRNLCQT